MSGVVTVYATFADRAEAERIGRQMVEERLAACVNILGDAHSIYRWQGQIETATETAALFKTAADRAEPLTARIVVRALVRFGCLAAGLAHAALLADRKSTRLNSSH